MGRRYRLKSRPKAYVERSRTGQFKRWASIKRSQAVDKRRVGKTVKAGYGHQGDLARKGHPMHVIDKAANASVKLFS